MKQKKVHYAVWHSEPSSSAARLSYVSANRISIDDVDINLVPFYLREMMMTDESSLLSEGKRERRFQVNLFVVVVVRMAADCVLADDDCRHC